jgi:hypothetical protein
LSHATIAPGCPQPLDAGFQVTVGRSPRFTCWSGKDWTLCGWRLPDGPVALKRVIESDYPTKMTLRWRWRGLGAAVRTRYMDGEGNRVGPGASATLTVPLALGVEVVDGGAVSCGLPRHRRPPGAAPRARRVRGEIEGRMTTIRASHPSSERIKVVTTDYVVRMSAEIEGRMRRCHASVRTTRFRNASQRSQ